MIHSLSGGVIKDGGLHTFVKVDFGNDVVRWFLCDDYPVEVGYNVIAPLGRQSARGVAVRVDKWVDERSTPIPYKHAQSVISVEII